jgi:hypothetical protein
VTGIDHEKWSGRLDSNQRPPAPKAAHLIPIAFLIVVDQGS